MRILYMLIAFTAISCSRPTSDLPPVRKVELTPFTVTVAERAPFSAIIKWTEGATNPAAVRYKVILEGKVVKSGLTERTDTLVNLKSYLSYTGSVCVYTPAGDSLFAPFALNKVQIDPRPLRPFTVTVIDRAPATAIIEWPAVFNFYDAEIVKYDVMLNGQIIKPDLLQTRDTIRGLSMDNVYNGRILAHTATGDTSSAPFLLERLNGYVFYGGGTNGMLCYNLFTGQRVWKSDLSTDEFYDMPLIVDDRLFVNTRSSNEGGVCAFDTKTGQRIWKTQLSATYSPNDYFNPVYKNNTVYTVLSDGIYALQASTGSLAWKYTPPNEDFTVNPVIAGNMLFIIMRDTDTPAGYPLKGKIVALNILTGAVVWQKVVNYLTSKNPAIWNNLLIYGASDGKIYALNQSDGSLNWSKDLSVAYNNYGSHVVSPLLYNNTVIVHNFNRGYYALNVQNGSTIWNYPDVSSATSPTIGNGKIFFSTISPNSAVALDIATGTQAWSTPLTVYTSSPIFVKNRIYFSTSGGFLVYNAINGQYIQQLNTLSGTNYHGAPAIVSDDLVYYPAESGMLQ